MREGRGAVLVVVILAVALAGTLLIGAPASDVPLDPRSDEPGGTSALMELVRELGGTVHLDVAAPGPNADVALVLRDRFSDDERDALRRWVREGGTLVVVDPGSTLTPHVPGWTRDGELDEQIDDPVDEIGGNADPVGFDITIEVRAGVCDIAPLDDPDISWVNVYGGVIGYEVAGAAESCFGQSRTAYIVATPTGAGTIVALGGSGIILNRTLDEGDNAAVIAALLAPREGTNLAVLDPNVPASSGDGESGPGALWKLVPTGVKRGLVQVGLAFLLYVWWRSRRLGKPMVEPQPVKAAGSDLVAAVGGLLERARSPQHAADVLRADLRRDLTRQLGLPTNLRPEVFVQVVGQRSSLDPAQLAAALGPGEVHTDRDLLVVAQLIDHVRKEVFEHVGT